MRKLAWLGALALLLGIWAYVATPELGFRAAPEPPQGEQPAPETIRALGDAIEDIRLVRVERRASGIIAVDAEYTGENPPRTDEGWHQMAKEISNQLATSPANIQTIHLFLYHEGVLRSEGVTTRSE